MKDHHFDGAINVHQDWPYFGGGAHKLNVFVPLTPVSEENGGLVFLERSHFFRPLERGDLDVETYATDLVRTCPELEAGDVLLADFLTWHHSSPAKAPKDRIMLQLVYQPADDASSAHLLRAAAAQSLRYDGSLRATARASLTAECDSGPRLPRRGRCPSSRALRARDAGIGRGPCRGMDGALRTP